MTYNAFWISALIIVVATRKLFRVKLDVAAGILLYGILLFTHSIYLWLWFKTTHFIGWVKQEREGLPKKVVKTPSSVLDINSLYRLKPTELVFGLDMYKKPIRTDIERYHTLIVGTSGAGKTIMLNGLIAQLVGKGQDILANYDIHLLDLKSSEYDYLSLWKPVLAGYYPIDEDGSTQKAIEALEYIARHMHRSYDKRIIIIIDELAMLSSLAPNAELRKKGSTVLRRVSSQLRDRGALISATQRPHHEVVHKNVVGNMERRICLRVKNNITARMALEFTPSIDIANLQDGEFILSEPGRGKREVFGRTIMMNLPGEIDRAVSAAIQNGSEDDIRLQVFREACAGRRVKGAQLHGINKVYKGLPINNKDVEAYYRNYALAGAVVPKAGSGGKVAGYLLAEDFNLALKGVIDYIHSGQWKSNPEPLGKN